MCRFFRSQLCFLPAAVLFVLTSSSRAASVSDAKLPEDIFGDADAFLELLHPSAQQQNGRKETEEDRKGVPNPCVEDGIRLDVEGEGSGSSLVLAAFSYLSGPSVCASLCVEAKECDVYSFDSGGGRCHLLRVAADGDGDGILGLPVVKQKGGRVGLRTCCLDKGDVQGDQFEVLSSETERKLPFVSPLFCRLACQSSQSGRGQGQGNEEESNDECVYWRFDSVADGGSCTLFFGPVSVSSFNEEEGPVSVSSFNEEEGPVSISSFNEEEAEEKRGEESSETGGGKVFIGRVLCDSQGPENKKRPSGVFSSSSEEDAAALPSFSEDLKEALGVLSQLIGGTGGQQGHQKQSGEDKSQNTHSGVDESSAQMPTTATVNSPDASFPSSGVVLLQGIRRERQRELQAEPEAAAAEGEEGSDPCRRLCEAEPVPVCGTDGETYINACLLQADAECRGTGVTVAYLGECSEEETGGGTEMMADTLTYILLGAVGLVALTLGVGAVVTMRSKNEATRQRLKAGKILTVIVQIFDVTTDIVFLFVLAESRMFLLMGIAAGHFALYVIINALVLHRFLRNHVVDSEWFQRVHHTPLFSAVLVFSALGLRTFNIVDTGLFGVDVLSWALPAFEDMRDPAVDRLLMSQLYPWNFLEDLPQLILQAGFYVLSGQQVSLATLLAMLSTLVSISVSLIQLCLLQTGSQIIRQKTLAATGTRTKALGDATATGGGEKEETGGEGVGDPERDLTGATGTNAAAVNLQESRGRRSKSSLEFNKRSRLSGESWKNAKVEEDGGEKGDGFISFPTVVTRRVYSDDSLLVSAPQRQSQLQQAEAEAAEGVTGRRRESSRSRPRAETTTNTVARRRREGRGGEGDLQEGWGGFHVYGVGDRERGRSQHRDREGDRRARSSLPLGSRATRGDRDFPPPQRNFSGRTVEATAFKPRKEKENEKETEGGVRRERAESRGRGRDRERDKEGEGERLESRGRGRDRERDREKEGEGQRDATSSKKKPSRPVKHLSSRVLDAAVESVLDGFGHPQPGDGRERETHEKKKNRGGREERGSRERRSSRSRRESESTNLNINQRESERVNSRRAEKEKERDATAVADPDPSSAALPLPPPSRSRPSGLSTGTVTDTGRRQREPSRSVSEGWRRAALEAEDAQAGTLNGCPRPPAGCSDREAQTLGEGLPGACRGPRAVTSPSQKNRTQGLQSAVGERII
uniref:Kazal-like domain-containing protein n=1 Tax=Chromera velia CCMP2878 TaxID=1169474 RepID=A0A0G4FPJ4_9ALVE|eukprot:Cvel_17999.t1-p1 / transcript=Cvel_17999.t1 / gene=Cvel_17999 / organism=Chromera_velia_CCMP2878 / gene_product=hypothetical protein / transcript_product=hypothetical protein / location=Cvel_scaffold1467:19048-25903(+) / protein_length=1209 / sequence_SO=supercontig / SO=protein_coding / is_pseudo=false